MHNSVNIPKIKKLYTLNESTIQYVNYILIKQLYFLNEYILVSLFKESILGKVKSIVAKFEAPIIFSELLPNNVISRPLNVISAPCIWTDIGIQKHLGWIL